MQALTSYPLAGAAAAPELDSQEVDELGRNVLLRLALPACGFMLLSSLDRVNVSFAALQMNQELGFTPSQYGFGAGILFAGFLAGQYPSVLLLQRIGMRRWLPLCAVSWACFAAALAGVTRPWEFYLLRVLLGFAEGGLAPGIVLYLSQFISNRRRATTFALPMLAIPLSIVIGGPVSGWLMSRSIPLGLAPWRFMIVAESLPVIVLGLSALRYFPDHPRQASWISERQLRWLAVHSGTAGRPHTGNDWRILRDPLVWACALLWFCLLSGAYGIMFWLPQMIKQLAGLTPLQIGLVNALPWIGAMLGTYFNSSHSDRTGERLWHVAVPSVCAGTAIIAAWLLGPSLGGVVALTVGGVGLGAAQGAFWAIPTRYLTAATFAVASVAINISGSSGGIIMPHLIGYLVERTGGLAAATLLIGGILAMAAILTALIGVFYFRRPQPTC